MFRKFSYILLFTSLISCALNRELRISTVDLLEDSFTDTINGRIRYNREDYFMVEGGFGMKSRVKQEIDKYIKLHGKNIPRYYNYGMTFFWKSKNVNLENI